MPPKKEAPPPSNAVRFGRVKANLKMGIVGLPNVGKSSLFNLLCEQSVEAANFPFCTIDPNESRCAVPDERYEFMCNIWNPPSRQPAWLNVTDIAGLIKGASEGQGLGNAFLSHIQAVDGIYHVLRCFENTDIVHVEDHIDPVRDLEIIQSELCKKDLEIVAKAYAAEELAVRKSGGKFKLSPTFISAFDKMKALLEAGTPVRMGEYTSGEIELINEKARLITTKPIIYLANLSKEDFIRKKNKWLPKVHKWIQEHGGGPMIPISVEYEEELWSKRSDPGVLEEYIKQTGAPSILPKVIKAGYGELNLIGFLTAGEKEVRYWTIVEGTLAPQAAGVIHSDIEKNFIKAGVVSFADFKEFSQGEKSMANVKAAGKYRLEGKSYKVGSQDSVFNVQDADIIHFEHNAKK
ncbi:hypothetical protein HDU76_013751 [Blyttiomyces sp. JEL0837]|nr:hypothetical protein HDU76_013751 [Blyttiomyces sp. JEL0837]